MRIRVDIPEKLQRKAGKNYKGWFCYTFGITSAFDLRHTAILRMDRQLLPMGKNFLSVTDFSKANNKNNNNNK